MLRALDRTGLEFELPRLLGFSAPHGALAIEWAPRARSLHAIQVRRRGLPLRLARPLGEALASLHASAPGTLIATESCAELVRCLAWPTVAWYSSLNPASVSMLSRVQQAPGALEALVSLAEAAANARLSRPVHGDFRHANLLRRGKKWLWVDWELAGLSDPAADLGAAFGEALGTMVAPRFSSEALSRRGTEAWLSSLWEGYRGRAGADETFGLRALQWAGEALLRRVYSQTHYDSYFDQNSGHLIDAALELLIRPRAWRARLLESRR